MSLINKMFIIDPKINRMLENNDNWIVEEMNKLSKNYFYVNDIEMNNPVDMDVDENENTSKYTKNIYLRIQNFYKKSNKEQIDNPLKFKYDYYLSDDKQYPTSVNEIIRLTPEEIELRNQYKKY